MSLETVDIAPLPPQRFEPLLLEAGREEFRQGRERGRRHLEGRVVWNVNSTAHGGGVAELLAPWSPTRSAQEWTPAGR